MSESLAINWLQGLKNMPLKYREIEKRLLKTGYRIVRQKGSHVIFSNGKDTFPVPKHGSRDISPGVERRFPSYFKINDLRHCQVAKWVWLTINVIIGYL